ncbi:MAG: protein kinase [Deltaproteobacteria bacterium]|nr:protein kinase [Deltaproteobacteria bacterium]
MSDTADANASFLLSLAPFASLSPSAARLLADEIRVTHHESGARIVGKGETGDTMFVVRSGRVRVPVTDLNGRERLVAQLGPGDFFGEMALLTGEPRAADVYAMEPTETLEIQRERLEKLLSAHPKVAAFLSAILGKRLLEGDRIRRVGKYSLIGELGVGGVAIVYEGLHPTLSKTVAVKMLSHELVYDPEFADRFKDEARIIASLEHDNIVQVHDVEQAFGTYFIIMEKVSGTLLQKMIEAGPIPFDVTRSILRQLASALELAHSRGVVHRDVKPSNLIVEPSGNVKLMDFGIAKTVSDVREETSTLGTLGYCSPEQLLRDKKIDGRADIYSMGIMAFEMLTGRKPFQSDDPAEVVRKHLTEPVPSPRSLNPEIPVDLDMFVSGATQKSLEQRFPNCREVIKLFSAAAKTDLEDARAKMVLVLFPPEAERAITQILSQLSTVGMRMPGVRIAISDAKLS